MMTRYAKIVSVCACAAALGLTLGCNGSQRTTDSAVHWGRSDFSSRRFHDTSLTVVETAAERAFKQRYPLNHQASARNLWVSRPVEIDGRDQPARVSDVLGVSTRRQRQIASLQLVPQGPDVLIRCQVQNQRLESGERGAFARTRGQQGSDLPTETPIERRDASAPNATEEWVNTRRDVEAERKLIEAVDQAITAHAAGEL